MQAGQPITSDAILGDLIKILEEMTVDWDTDFSGKICSETYLKADLGFGSINVVYLIAELQERYGRRDFLSERLFVVGGKPVLDLKVGDLVEFIVQRLNDGSPDSGSRPR